MENQEWMTLLPEHLKNIPIINLAIPGSHDSMTYGISNDSNIAPDAEDAIRRLFRFLPCFVRRWCITQSANVLEQLQLGVRYFDLRICQQNYKFYFVHGLYAMEIFEPLQEILNFLNAHTGEVVILDFQHFYAMDAPQYHIELQKCLLALFGSRLYATTDGDLTDCTLNRCQAFNKQVVLIYRRCPIDLPSEFWPSNAWPTPWPNKTSAKQLEQFLDDALLTRQPTQGYVSQCVLTPNPRYIIFRFLSSLRKTAKKVDKQLIPWVIRQRPGIFAETEQPTVNVIIADFVNLKDGIFCSSVIELNKKIEGAQREGDLETIKDNNGVGWVVQTMDREEYSIIET